MKGVRITVLRRTLLEDLIAQYGGPGLGACELHDEGEEYVSNGWQKPEGLCDNAWKSMQEYVMTLAHGGRDFYGNGWLNGEDFAIISCNDGLRPVIFRVQAID